MGNSLEEAKFYANDAIKEIAFVINDKNSGAPLFFINIQKVFRNKNYKENLQCLDKY